MNEAETRAELIDPALKAAGWGEIDGSRVRREVISPGRLQGSGKRSKAEIADYVLAYRNHKLAVVEAKKRDTPVGEGVGQAKAYAKKLAVRFTYATNGLAIYGIDMQTGEEGDVDRFPTPAELWDRTFAVENAWRNRFAAVPYEDKGGTWSSRYYQEIAINNVLEAIAAGKERILLTLATGTGKTAIAFQIAWKLYHSRWNLRRGVGEASDASLRRPRILFLADRNILADQAYNAFSAFEDSIPGSLVRISPDEIRQRGRVPMNGSIFFTIFQTFMSGQTQISVRPEPVVRRTPALQRRSVTPGMVILAIALIGSVIFGIYAITVRDSSQIPLLAAGGVVMGIVFIALAVYSLRVVWRAGIAGRDGRALMAAVGGGIAFIIGAGFLAGATILLLLSQPPPPSP